MIRWRTDGSAIQAFPCMLQMDSTSCRLYGTISSGSSRCVFLHFLHSRTRNRRIVVSSDSLRNLRVQVPRTPSVPPQTGQGTVSCPVIIQIPSLKYLVKSDTLTMTGESRGSSSPDREWVRLTMENGSAASFFLSADCYAEGPAPQTPRDLSRGRFPSGLSSSTPALFISCFHRCVQNSVIIYRQL